MRIAERLKLMSRWMAWHSISIHIMVHVFRIKRTIYVTLRSARGKQHRSTDLQS